MSWSILVSSYDRKAERTARFNKKKQSKNKARTKGYRKEQLQEKVNNMQDMVYIKVKKGNV